MPRSSVPRVFKKRKCVGKPKVDVGLGQIQDDAEPTRVSDCRPTATTPNSSEGKGSSNIKLTPNLKKYTDYGSSDFNILLNSNVLKDMFTNSARCTTCDNSLDVQFGRQYGLASEIVVVCEVCDVKSKYLSSPQVTVNKGDKDKRLFDSNIRYVYGLRSIGKGPKAGKLLAAILNLPLPPSKFSQYTDLIGHAVKEVATESMTKALQEAIESNGGSTDLSIALDGTWQKRGHTSLNGVVTATSFDSGKVIDLAIRSKFCRCKEKSKNLHDGNCCANYSGVSGGIEISGVKEIFERSIQRNVRYEYYLGNGDSKAFQSVSDSNIYMAQTSKLKN